MRFDTQAIAFELQRARRPRLALEPAMLQNAEDLLLAVREIHHWNDEVPEARLWRVAHQHVRSAISRLDRELRAQANFMLGLTESSASLTLKERYARLSSWLVISVETYRTEREPQLYLRIAENIAVVLEEVARRAEIEPAPRALDSALEIDWIGLSRLYSRTEGALAGLQSGLANAYRARNRVRTKSTYDDFILASLYWYSVAAALDANRDRDFGGQWLMTTDEAERACADSLWEILSHLAPFTERETSALRSLILSSKFWELDEFASAMDDRQARLLVKWGKWEASCDCVAEDLPRASCLPHQVAYQVDQFSLGVRSHWNDLTDWYSAASWSFTDNAPK